MNCSKMGSGGGGEASNLISCLQHRGKKRTNSSIIAHHHFVACCLVVFQWRVCFIHSFRAQAFDPTAPPPPPKASIKKHCTGSTWVELGPRMIGLLCQAYSPPSCC